MPRDVESYIEELREITEKLQGGELKLQEAVELYKRGSQAAAKAEKLMNRFEGEIELIETGESEDADD
jgi:exodeoxyribonuclease VII small subunit